MTGPLGRRLAEIRAGAPDRIDADTRALMKRATAELRESSILDELPRVGDRAPGFARPNLDGRTVRLGALLREGPVVASFFRGRW